MVPWVLLSAILMLAVGAGVAVSMVSSDGASSSDPFPVNSIGHEFPGNHLHGIGFDSQGERLFLATHYGLFVLQHANDDWGLYQLGSNRDDFMGFSQDPHNPGIIFTSGHPASGGNLGILRSTDEGLSFEQIFDGPAGEPIDFHSMTISPADPSVLYGHYWGDGMLYRTTDGGESWERFRGAGLPDRGLCWAAPCLAADPVDPDTVWAGTEEGLMVSRDGGRSWEPTPLNGPVAGVGIGPGLEPRFLAMVPGQGLVASFDGGESWEASYAGMDLADGEFVFQVVIDLSDPNRAFAATVGQRVFESRDGGKSWSVILR